MGKRASDEANLVQDSTDDSNESAQVVKERKPEYRHNSSPSPERSKMTIELPRDSLFAQAVRDLHKPATDVEGSLPTADHIEEARRECVYQFLEQVFLPRMEQDTPLTLEELTQAAMGFKHEFRKTHPNDFTGRFELITAAEMELLQLHSRYKAKESPTEEESKVARLVDLAIGQLKPLLDKYPEDLFSI